MNDMDINTHSLKAQENARLLRIKSDELHRQSAVIKEETEKLLKHIDRESWKIVMTEMGDGERDN